MMNIDTAEPTQRVDFDHVRDGDDFILNGSKMFIAGAGSTDFLVVMARTGGEGASGVSAFAVDAKCEGISYGRKEDKMGWNSQPTRMITFEDIRVPAINMLGEERDGFYVRDTRVHRILEGTNEIMRLIISRRVLAEGATEL